MGPVDVTGTGHHAFLEQGLRGLHLHTDWAKLPRPSGHLPQLGMDSISSKEHLAGHSLPQLSSVVSHDSATVLTNDTLG